jgi:predicted transcriptional regulator
MTADCPVDFVRLSGVRTAVLSAVVGGTDRTRDIVEDLDASESAVYEAVDALMDRGIIEKREGGWEPTGVGIVVADLLERQRHTTDVLNAAPEYWQSHDTSVLPVEFRERLADFRGFEVVAGTDADPGRAVRAGVEDVRTADRLDAVAAVYHDQVADVLSEGDRKMRFVLARSLAEGLVSDPPPSTGPTDAPTRTAPVDFSVTVTDQRVYLSLPRSDGTPDIQRQVVAEGDRAIRWGRDLFEHCWEAAVPVAEAMGDAWPPE